MREIVRNTENSITQVAAIDWDSSDLYTYHIFYFMSSDHENDLLPFHENVEWLYKKWLLGEEIEFTIPVKQYQWNYKDNPVPDLMLLKEKNEYLSRKAQKKIQQAVDKIQFEKFAAQIKALHEKITTDNTREELQQIDAEAKKIDELLKKAVAATRNISLQDGIVAESIGREDFLALKELLAALFADLKKVRDDAYFANYNILGARVEVAYAQSKSSENFNDTRKEIIALQKELFEANLNRWQKDELIARIRSAFDQINQRHDDWRSGQVLVKNEQAQQLQVKYDEVITGALALPFNEGFNLLKDLQEQTNHSNLTKESRQHFYQKLDEAFGMLKSKADVENEVNFKLAEKTVDAAIAGASASELFKDARAILTAAQNDLKTIRLSKKTKDALFDKLREAFNDLNQKQDAYFIQRKKENNEHLQNLLQTLKRALVRKEEGMERLYQARQNVEAKTGMFKNTKGTNNELLNQFLARLTDMNNKIETAEKEMGQLKKKVEKIEKELEQKL